MNKQIGIYNISLTFDDMPILDNISFDVSKRDFLLITGPNGGGKTSLLRIILGLLRPNAGKVVFYDNDQSTQLLQTGYLPQKNSIDHSFPITVSEVITSGLMDGKHLFRRITSVQKERVTEVVDLMGLNGLEDRPIGKLSGGQLQRALLGRAIAKQPDILILDEPSSYMDKQFEDRMYALLTELNKTITILIVSHDTSVLDVMASRIIRIDKTLEIVK